MSQDDDKFADVGEDLYANTRFGQLAYSIATMFEEHPDILPAIIEGKRAAIQAAKNPSAVERAQRGRERHNKKMTEQDMHKLEDPIVPIEDMLEEVETEE